MEQIELVIKLTTEGYQAVKDGRASVRMMRDAIKDGTPLPKGHGALKDVSKFLYECKLDYGCERICDCTNCVHHVIRERDVGNALTIIEADKEGAEDGTD